MSALTTLLAVAPIGEAVDQAGVAVTTGEQIAFWVLAPLALLGAVGMIFAKNAVHSALWLVLTMLCLGCMYLAQQAQFLGFAQIIVYTGAIMMLFLFVLMLTGRESSDSVIEVLRGQRVAALLVGLGFVGLLTTGIIQAVHGLTVVGYEAAVAGQASPGDIAANVPPGEMRAIASTLFTDFLFPFELTSALLITAALGAMVLAHVEKRPGEKRNQRDMVAVRMRSGRMSPLPGPGVFATSSSNATPALLPDGSIAPESVSVLVEQGESRRVAAQFQANRSLTAIESAGSTRTGADGVITRSEDSADGSADDTGSGSDTGPASGPSIRKGDPA